MAHKHVAIDSYAYTSGLRGWNATFKVSFAVAAVVLTVAFGKPETSLATLFFMLVLTIGKGRIPLHDYLHLLSIPLFFIVFGGLAIMLQAGTPEDAIWTLAVFGGHLSVAKSGLLLAVRTGLTALGAVSALYMLSLSTPMGEILSVLRRLHIPELLLELMHLIYRYIFILAEIHRQQREASLSRMGYRDFRTGLRTFGSELANLFVLAMKKSNAYYDAMEARGYAGSCRFWEEPQPFTWKQGAAAAAYLVLLAAVCMI